MDRNFFLIFTFFLGVFASEAQAAQAEQYDATVDQLFHGALIVIDLQCHHHDLASSSGGSGVSRRSFDYWGAHHYNIHITSHHEDRLEIADEIYPRDGANAISKCTSEQQSFATHSDGAITSWSEGNAIGNFTLKTRSGATKDFSFFAGREPPINGQRLFCENYPDPRVGCSDEIMHLIKSGVKVRVYFKIIDSPDGPSEQVTQISIL